jgi:hypothetical protein
MFEMGLHDPFQLKHKLWSKEGSGVKLPIWLPTIKSLESPRFPYVQVACNIMLKSSWRGLQLCFRPHLNQSLHTKLWAPKVTKDPTLGISGFPLGNPETKCHLDAGPMARHRVYYKGEGGGCPQLRVVVSLVSQSLVLTPKVPSYAVTNLLFGLCKSVWVIDCLLFCLVSSWSSSTPLYPQSVASQGTCSNSLFFRCSHLKFTFESI